MTTPSIVEFLAARLQEDEDTARAAARAAENGYNTEPPWEFDNDEVVIADGRGIITGPWGIEHEIARHVERFQPARVLCEVASKRAILELGICLACDVELQPCDHREDTLRALAAVYSDHPDYDETWKP